MTTVMVTRVLIPMSALNSGIGLSGKPKSQYSLWNVLPRGGAWNRAIWPIAEMLANVLTANRGEC